jgi:uncharacterized membrane protein YbhN (UPF0104 family)
LAELLDTDKLKILSLFVLSLVFVSGIAVIDGLSMWYGFSLFGVKLKIKEILLIRAAMMILASIATLIGQAALGTLMTKKYGVSAGKSAGMVILLFILEIYGMVALTTVFLPVLFLFQYPENSQAWAAGLLVITTWPALFALIIISRKTKGAKIFEKLKISALISPLNSLKNIELFKLLSFKTMLAFWQILMSLFALEIYGLHLPFLEFFTFTPVCTLVSAMPVTPAKLGTTQWVWVFFFEYGLPAVSIVAYTLFIQFMLNVARWVVGLFALPFVYKDVMDKK